MRCALYLARNTPPFTLIREIHSATNIDRLRPMDKPGTMSFHVSITEGVVTNAGLMSGTVLMDGSPLDADLIQEGSAVIDYSSEGLLPWLWYIQQLHYDVKSGRVDVQCQEWRQLLHERQVPLNSPAKSRAAPTLATLLLQAANSRNPTHIRPHLPLSGYLRTLPAETIQYGGLMLGQAFDEVKKRTNSEWFLHYHIGWNFCEPTLHWVHRRGTDRRAEVQLSEGVHLSSVTYVRDAREVPRVVRFIQGGRESPGLSPAGAVAASTSAAARNRATDVGSFESPLETDRRRALRAPGGPTVQAEVLEVLPQGASDQALLGAALRRLQVPIVAVQSIELTLRNRKPIFDVSGADFLTPNQPLWSSFDLGDVITVRLASPEFLAGVDLDVRVTALQPDEATGEMVIVAQVQS